MTLFEYTARKDDSTEKEKGEIIADSIGEATKKIREQQMIPISIVEKTEKKGLSFKRTTVPLREKIIFTRQLSVMVKAGLPLVNALQALQRQSENKYFQEVIEKLITEVRGGQTLSKVMEKYPKVFPEVYVAVIRAGESTGQLAEVLLTLAEQQEKQAELIAKVKGALMYPAIIMIALLGVVALIVFFVLPSMQSIFTDYDAELPLTTQLLFASSTFARNYWWLLLILTAAFIYGLKLWFSQPAGRLVYDRIRLVIPVFGGLTKKVYMANFSRTMAMLTKASLPILQSIKIVQKTIANKHYDMAFNRIATAVENGQPLSKAISKEPIFPPMVTQLTSLGEQSGELESVFMEVARFYDSEVDNITRNLASLIEPILLIVMGAGVGFVVASVLGPIYKLVGQF